MAKRGKTQQPPVAPPVSRSAASPVMFPISVADGLLWARLGVDRDYRLRARTAPGSYGIVYLAHSEGKGDVAVKGIGVLHSRSVDAVHTALCAAVERAGRVGDPAVLVPFQCGRSETAVYYIAPWVAGGSVLDELRPGKPLPLARVVAILRAVAPALDRAHEKGLVHGGIRPGNLLVDSKGRVLLGDFGVAAALAPLPVAVNAEAARGQAYTAPEQWRNGVVDGRADQYALALVAYELLTAQSRFDGKGIEGVPTLEPLEIHDVVPLREDIPLYVNSALRTALSAKPANRFPTITAFVDALEGKRAGAVAGEQLVRFRIGDIKPRHVVFTLSGALGLAAIFALGDVATDGALRSELRIFSDRYLPNAPTMTLTTSNEPGAVQSANTGGGGLAGGNLAGGRAFGGNAVPSGGAASGGRPASYGAGEPRGRSTPYNFGPELTNGSSRGSAPATRATTAGSTSGTASGKRLRDFTVTPPPPGTPRATEGERKPAEDGLFASLYARAREAMKSALANDTSRDSAASNAVRPLDGTVSVDADGGPAMITVDGVPMGTTPATLHLLPGRHTVAVRGARQYTPSEVVVTVTRGGKTGASFRAR